MAFADALTKRLALVLTAESSGAVRALKDTAREVDTTNAKLEKLNKVKIDPPTGGLGKWVDDLRARGGVAGKTLDQLGISGANAGAALQAGLVTGTAAGGAALAAFGVKAVNAASNLTEQANKASVVFGSASSSVTAFAKAADSGFGLSERAALAAASSFGTLLKATGQNQQGIADMSVRLSKLAGDLASFNNISTGDAIQKLMSGLSGEAEPLRQVGVFLTETKVKAEAYASGIAKVGAELTEGQKVQARYNVILRETQQAQGDFARTSGSLANQQRILAAQIENLEASIGTLLLPTVTSLLRALNEGMRVVDMFGQAVSALSRIPGIGTPLKIAIEYQIPVIGPALAGLDLFKASYRGTMSVLNSVFTETERQATVTDAAVQALIGSLQKGGAAGQSFLDRIKSDPGFAAYVNDLTQKFPALAAAIQTASAATDGFTASQQQAADELKNAQTQLDQAIAAWRDLPAAQLAAERAARTLAQAQRDLANVGDAVRLSEIERIQQGRQIVALQESVRAAENEVAAARRGLAAATQAEIAAEQAYVQAIETQHTARIRLTEAEDEFKRVSQGRGAQSREYAEATDDVTRATLAAADAEVRLAQAKQFAVQAYNLELAQARLAVQQAQQSYQQQVVSLAAIAIASGQAAAAQQLLSSAFLDGAAAAQANAQATLLVAQAQLQAIQNANALASAQQAVTNAQNAYSTAQANAQQATRDLNDALEQQRLVLQGYGADSREAADALRELNNAQLDASDAALDLADANDRVTAAQANLAKARATGDQNAITRAERELQRAQNAQRRAEQRLEDARKAAGVAQANAQGTVSGFDPNSTQAQAAANAVTQAQNRQQQAVAAVGQAYQAMQQAIQNVATVQLQQSIAAQQQQIQMAQQVAATTLAIQGQGLSLQQAQATLAQLAADPGKPFREIQSAALEAKKASADLNTALETQKGYLSGFGQSAPQYKTAWDNLRTATANYEGAQRAANEKLRDWNNAKTQTDAARAAVETSMKNLKTTASDVALKIEAIRISMKNSETPAQIYATKLDAVKEAELNLAGAQARVKDDQQKIQGVWTQYSAVQNYATALSKVATHYQSIATTLPTIAQYLPQAQAAVAVVAQAQAPRPATSRPPTTTPPPSPVPTGTIPGRALGGPVAAGSPYIVGERGPELFVPRTSGTIVPNGGRDVNVTFTGDIVVRSDADIDALAQQVARAIKASLN